MDGSLTDESAELEAPSDSQLSLHNNIISSLLDQHSNAYWDTKIDSAQRQIDADSILLDRLSETGCAQPSIRIWQNEECLVVPKSWRANAKFEWAKERCPLPVALRVSGGGAVIHGPHILNVSIGQRLERCDIAALFRLIYDFLLPIFHEMGLNADIGFVSGAHCNGKYNIRLNGKKLAGTASFTRSFAGRQYVMTHASISILERESDLAMITMFETDIGLAPAYSASAHTSLEEELAGV